MRDDPRHPPQESRHRCDKHLGVAPRPGRDSHAGRLPWRGEGAAGCTGRAGIRGPKGGGDNEGVTLVRNPQVST